MARGLPLIVILMISALLAVTGCGDKKTPSPAPQVPPERAGTRKTFDMNCGRCHWINAPADAEKMKGPDLGKVAAPPEHTREWILAYIRDPQSKKADSKMPKFGVDKLSDEDLGALADYLATLK